VAFPRKRGEIVYRLIMAKTENKRAQPGFLFNPSIMVKSDKIMK